MRSRYKKAVRFIILLLVVAIAILFLYPMKNGKPLLSLDKLHLPPMPDISLPGHTPSEGEPVTVYRWRDSDGNLHFSNERPPSGVEYQTGSIDPNANVIQSSGATATAPPSEPSNRQSTANDAQRPGYSTEDISRMLEPTDKVRNAAEQRRQKQQSIIEAE